MRPQPSSRNAVRSRRGFTLIELLTVIVILSILMVFLVPKLMGAEDVVRVQNTKNFLMQLRTVVADYENESGDFPASVFSAEQGAPPNQLNLGAEALVANLWADGFDGLGLDDSHFGNTDGDQSAKRITTLGNRELFELVDDWQNPIAYFHRSAYGETHAYVTSDPETGLEIPDNQVKAKINPVTDRFENPKTCQLISAGPDGLFGTDDDLVQ